MKPRETRSKAPAERLRHMHNVLAAAYGPQHWWPAKTAFEVILGAYLTQNTSWKVVEHSLANLRRAGALALEGIRALPLDELRELIRPSGFITRKAPAIKAFVSIVDREFAGSLSRMRSVDAEALRTRLLALPGVGPETADAILLYAFNKPVPVADEYLRRIVERHGLLKPTPGRNGKGYQALVNLTREAFARDPEPSRPELFNEFHALVVAVGKSHCGRAPDCAHCPLAADLDEAGIPHPAAKPATTRR